MTAGDSWRLENVEASGLEMTDAEAQIAAVLCAQICRRIPSLSPAVKAFFAELSVQLNTLVAWRLEWIWHLDQLMADVPDMDSGE